MEQLILKTPDGEKLYKNAPITTVQLVQVMERYRDGGEVEFERQICGTEGCVGGFAHICRKIDRVVLSEHGEIYRYPISKFLELFKLDKWKITQLITEPKT